MEGIFSNNILICTPELIGFQCSILFSENDEAFSSQKHFSVKKSE